VASPSTGTPFGRYQLIRKLASGGMAEVYLAELATAAGLRKQLVIKKILRHYADDPEFREMFIGEARIAVGLSHGNIAQVFDFGEVEGEYFLALEYVSGRSVADLFKRANDRALQVPIELAAFIALQICQGLHYAHTRVDGERRPMHLVHRDISPQNVLVSYEGQVKVVDFGIAKAYGAAGLDGRSNTASGVVKGKYLYFSPEQAAAKPLDALTDVFATGVVLYEMLCGRRPYEGQMYAVLARQLTGDFPRPRSFRPELPEALEAVVLRAMATQREERFASALDMQESLAGFLSEYAPRLTQATLTNLMRLLFREDLVAAGEDAGIPESFAAQARLWAKTEPRPTAAAPPTQPDRGSRARPPGTAEPVTPPEPRTYAGRRPWLAIGAGVAGLASVVGIIAYSASGPSRPAQMEAINLVVPAHAPSPAPAPVAPPPAPVAPPEVAPPVDQLASLALLPKARHGGRLVVGLVCDGEPKHPAAKASAARAGEAASSSRFNEATVILNEAIGSEPTAGGLYLALADDASSALNPTHLDLVLRDLETFRAACPNTRRPLIEGAYDRLSDLAEPPAAEAPGRAGEVSADSHRKVSKLRADAEDLMHRGKYDLALVKIQTGLDLDPSDGKLHRLLQACLASSGGADAPPVQQGGFMLNGSGKGRR
jgi:serine/threonine protein kinase